MNRYQKLLFDIANSKEVELLPKPLRDQVVALRDEEEERVRKWEAEIREREREREEATRKEREEERRKFLCIGEWGENVPPKRRFALCCRMGREFIGWIGQERDPSKWKEVPEYCAIDLVRGIMNPYWGYWGANTEEGQRNAFYNEGIRPVLEAFDAGDEPKALDCIRRDWDFFKIDRKEDVDMKFMVLHYHLDKGAGHDGFSRRCSGPKADRVVIDGRSELKTLAEHQEDLKREFCKENTSET